MGFLMSLRSHLRLDFTLFLFGLSRIGLVFSLFLVDVALLEFSMLLQQFAHVGPVVSASGCGNFDLLLPLQSFACLEFTPPVLGSTRTGLIYTLSVIDTATLGPVPLIQSLACLASLLSALDYSKLESALSLHSVACLGLSPFVLGVSRMDSPVSTFDCVDIGLPLSLAKPCLLGFSVVCSKVCRHGIKYVAQELRLSRISYLCAWLRTC